MSIKGVLLYIFHFFTDRKLYILIASLVILGGLSLLIMDRLAMPAYTQYGHGITVPDVGRMPFNEATRILKERGLRPELASKRSNEAFPPDYVIDQTPNAGMIVKPNRKIYITVNSTTTPSVGVPDVENLSLRNAMIQLQNSGLQVGNITYESSRFRNSILRQSVPPGRRVDQNTHIDLVVGDGLGTRMVTIPDISGMHLTEAQNTLREAGLRIGSIRFNPTGRVQPNTVLGHDPDGRTAVFEGTAIDLLVSVSQSREEEQEAAPLIIDESDPGSQNGNDSDH